MSQDFEVLPIGTEAALRGVMETLTSFQESEVLRDVLIESEHAAINKTRAILAQIDAQRTGATDAG
jgi:hypothetical protein